MLAVGLGFFKRFKARSNHGKNNGDAEASGNRQEERPEGKPAGESSVKQLLWLKVDLGL